MTQAGTIDLGGSAQSKQGGSPWAAFALTMALALAMIGAVWFASNAGLVGGTAAKPVADRAYDQIEAQRGAAAVSTDAYLNGILDRAHATPYAGSAALSTDEYLNGILDRAHATPYAGGPVACHPARHRAVPCHAVAGGPVMRAPQRRLTVRMSRRTGSAVTLPPSATSGTFHVRRSPAARPSGIASAARSTHGQRRGTRVGCLPPALVSFVIVLHARHVPHIAVMLVAPGGSLVLSRAP